MSQSAEISVVGEACNGLEAYELCIRLRPDVVLMDMRMSEYDGGYGTQKIKQSFSDIRVLVLTTFDDKETVDKAVASGADGYILKEMDSSQIISSIKAVAEGVAVFSRNIFRTVIKAPVQSADFSLTDREMDILRLICDGFSNSEISSKLFLAEGTVRNNISRMLEKLNLKDRTQLAVFAIKNNIIQED